MSYLRKRLVVCLDGTWVNSDEGYNRPTASDPNYSLQVPTNVTRLYRALKKTGSDGMSQIVYYHPGVGTSGSFLDELAGGIFGAGVDENIREAYSFIATNYEPGDEIFLIGFSRGAFTARSVAGLITQIGLLNSKGMEYLYPIFKDAENIRDLNYKDKFPTIPFPNKPRSRREYRLRLEDEGLTRLTDPDGYTIKVRCVAVFETVGSLGIPDTNLSTKLRIPRSASNYAHAKLTFSTCKWYDTSLSNTVEHAFQALALDEVRTSFAPAVWERPRGVHTDLRQVWFCGAHSNVGGGLPDQELANVSIAWMMDQLSELGVAFEESTIDTIFEASVKYYYDQAFDGKQSEDSSPSKRWKQWAEESIYEEHKPVRPWGLGEIVQSAIGIYKLAGKTTRTPGMYHRIDPRTSYPTREFLEGTNERIHRSVRIRLGLEGLGFDDNGLYKCRALLKKGPWILEKVRVRSRLGERHRDGVESEQYSEEMRWAWVYNGPAEGAPPKDIMLEEVLGPYEKRLLSLNKGISDDLF
ncbi:hypothetical protein N7539_001494 [Penicillium diatomitis]|uniref:T6SS Phospholipase effector Tle1-like catalytic domain-containing protein n=1 Tax=Penicillium diatomitis TaxID=2819901 RepID=A0A9W9XH38_9EURO|nr:uncharacterized protein N7539_001494 [Penicillium diatomitis]KAJ5492748.1 hypothetical protein N7539_001494 [Penicillium diatomitis]